MADGGGEKKASGTPVEVGSVCSGVEYDPRCDFAEGVGREDAKVLV